ncbi:MAG TPA: hypothetical protein VFI95_15945 [Terriglobales bacterium]|nr:hypothetical protein [Terriglobales bacterium]
MYTGNLIDQLMAAVERVEMNSRAEQETAELERLYLAVAAGNSVQYEKTLLGVA